MPPADGIAFLAAFVANSLRGAFPPLDFLAVCLVRAMVACCGNDGGCNFALLTSVRVMSVFYSFSKSGAARAKISRHHVLNRYFCIFNMLLEYVWIMLLIYAMNMLYSPILQSCNFWVDKALNTKFRMIFPGQNC